MILKHTQYTGRVSGEIYKTSCRARRCPWKKYWKKMLPSGYRWVSTKNLGLCDPAVWPVKGNSNTNVLFYYINTGCQLFFMFLYKTKNISVALSSSLIKTQSRGSWVKIRHSKRQKQKKLYTVLGDHINTIKTILISILIYIKL